MAKLFELKDFISPRFANFRSPDLVYREDPSKDILRLAGNENLYGCSPKVKQALAGWTYQHFYPDPTQKELRELISTYTSVAKESIVVGNGAAEIIDLIIRLYVDAGDEVIDSVPSFWPFRVKTAICGGTFIEVPRDNDFAINITAIKSAVTKKTKLIVLVNPNNPTGTITPRRDILEILEMGFPVLADEAYAEFSGETIVDLTERYENLMVVRTFSKWAGLAGIRVGYGILPSQIASLLMKIKGTSNINAFATIAVRESLADLDYLRRNVKAIVNEREHLFYELSKFKFLKPVPSSANFIFCPVDNGKAHEIRERLSNRQIRVSAFDIPQGGNGLRISVGREEHTNILVNALQEVAEEMGI